MRRYFCIFAFWASYIFVNSLRTLLKVLKGGEIVLDDAKKMGSHRLEMTNRDDLRLSGIQKVISFEPELVLLVTDLGKMRITGKEMQVNNLNIEKGLLDVKGNIDCICYLNDKNGGQFSLKRMFK